jgi:hypothetical protein
LQRILFKKLQNFENLKNNNTKEYYKNNGKLIYNHYGRPIHCPETPSYKLLNYYIQSTAVDVALLGFSNIVNRIYKASLQEKIVPIFILHDALFVDIHEDYYYLVDKLCKAGSINIDKFEDTNFYLKVDNVH